MSELDDFLTANLARQLEAEKALINGDPGPRLAMWSTQDPVTVLGAMKDVIGAEEARQVFRWLATRFSNLTDYRFELVAAGASGDLAYTCCCQAVVVEPVGEVGASPRDAGADGADRTAADLGSFRVGQAQQLSEHKRGASLGLQPRDQLR